MHTNKTRFLIVIDMAAIRERYLSCCIHDGSRRFRSLCETLSDRSFRFFQYICSKILRICKLVRNTIGTIIIKPPSLWRLWEIQVEEITCRATLPSSSWRLLYGNQEFIALYSSKKKSKCLIMLTILTLLHIKQLYYSVWNLKPTEMDMKYTSSICREFRLIKCQLTADYLTLDPVCKFVYVGPSVWLTHYKSAWRLKVELVLTTNFTMNTLGN